MAYSRRLEYHDVDSETWFSFIVSPGTEIFHLNVTDNVTYTLTSVEPTYMLDYLTWHRDANDSQYVMAVNVTLDLEGLRDKHVSGDSVVNY